MKQRKRKSIKKTKFIDPLFLFFIVVDGSGDDGSLPILEFVQGLQFCHYGC